jgi:N-acetylmuramoyl-L-alanine amidase
LHIKKIPIGDEVNKPVSFITILISITACISILFAAEKPTLEHYRDKIVYINFSNTKSITIPELERAITSAKTEKADAVICNYGSLSKAILNSENTGSSLSIISEAAKLAVKNKMFFYAEVDFATVSNSNKSVDIKNNINLLVKDSELDGLFLSGVNFSSAQDYELLENIIVEAMMVKPFLTISISSKSKETNSAFADSLISKGIIDFVFDETSNYSIVSRVQNEEKLLPTYLKRLSPEYFVSLNLSNVLEISDSEVFIPAENRTKQIGLDKKINFILPSKTDSLKLRIGKRDLNISREDWVIPYNYTLNKDNSVTRTGNWIEFRRPFEKRTDLDFYNLLCRTKYPAKVKINDEAVKIYKTGIFFSKIKLKAGLNKLRAEAIDEKGKTVVYEDRVLYSPKIGTVAETQLKIFDDSIQPKENLVLTAHDYLTVSFTGTKGQKGIVEILPEEITFDCRRSDFYNSDKYEIQIPLSRFSKNEKHTIRLVLKPEVENSNIASVEKTLVYGLVVKDKSDFPLLTTTDNNSILTYSLASIRLGAPIRNELPKNVILKTSGIFGDYYRVRLSDSEEGYISSEYVKELPPGTITPSYFINPISCYPVENADIVKIPYIENVPYDVYPDPFQNRIVINLYGVKTSSTWIIHKSNLRFIEEITWQQVNKETYRIFVNLKSSKIWGYDLKPNGKELIFSLKYPPIYNLKGAKPLKGIKISIEAGHGGSNSGAVGLSGIKEKDINLKLSLLLEKLFKKKGAEVLQLRDSDKDMTLGEKRDMATNSDANIHFSIHANSSGSENEFLGTSGTCTFYHNPFWAKFAENVFDKLVELNLKPFGSVGSFNYKVTRMSEMPSILVEQAFMSNAEDEEKLADDNFRASMAQKIYDGLINYLKYMKE